MSRKSKPPFEVAVLEYSGSATVPITIGKAAYPYRPFLEEVAWDYSFLIHTDWSDYRAKCVVVIRCVGREERLVFYLRSRRMGQGFRALPYAMLDKRLTLLNFPERLPMAKWRFVSFESKEWHEECESAGR